MLNTSNLVGLFPVLHLRNHSSHHGHALDVTGCSHDSIGPTKMKTELISNVQFSYYSNFAITYYPIFYLVCALAGEKVTTQNIHIENYC